MVLLESLSFSATYSKRLPQKYIKVTCVKHHNCNYKLKSQLSQESARRVTTARSGPPNLNSTPAKKAPSHLISNLRVKISVHPVLRASTASKFASPVLEYTCSLLYNNKKSMFPLSHIRNYQNFLSETSQQSYIV